MICIMYHFQPTDALLSRNSPSINGTEWVVLALLRLTCKNSVSRVVELPKHGFIFVCFFELAPSFDVRECPLMKSDLKSQWFHI